MVDITTAADGKALGNGLWDISLTVGAQGLTRDVRIGSKRAADVSGKAATHVVDTAEGLRAVTLYTTKPHGNFTLDIGENKHEVLPHLGLDTIGWKPDVAAELVITGQCALGSYPDGALTVRLTTGDGDGNETTMDFPVTQPANSDTFTADVPVSSLSAGVWSGELRLADWTVPLPPLPEGAAPAKWRRRGLPWYAKPVPAVDGDEALFALHVAKTELVKAMVGRLKP